VELAAVAGVSRDSAVRFPRLGGAFPPTRRVGRWLTERVSEIPDVRWGRSDGVLGRTATRIASTGPGSWLVRTMMPLDRKVLLRTEGRRTLLGPIGAPTLLLETTGRKTGQKRLSPLLFARDDDGQSVIVVGSNFGQQHHPAWTGNLLADPAAVVVTGGRRVSVRATLLDGEEAEAAYRKMIEVTSVYQVYRGRTDRKIRVFRLTPVD
jgi:deazaflavin-dependent oxidoreductase (nitroreductase family)